MQFLAKLLCIRAPKSQQLLDIALLLSLIPYLFALESFIIIYLLIAFYFIFKKEPHAYDSFILFSIGLVLMLISFFNTYNFSDFSRMQFFVSLVSSLLILALTLQRLTKVINFYLKISPALLMLLSFFFFDTISMLFYSLFVFFSFVLLSIWSRMQSTLGEVLRFNTALFLLSLPAVVVLFIAFPRISFEKAEFGFRGDNYTSSEYDGSMYVDSRPFIASNKIVMEVFFEKNIPNEHALYFRGSVLYPKDASSWENDVRDKAQERLTQTQELIKYDVLMYPHAKKWLYPLDVPTKGEYKKAQLQEDYTLLAPKNIYEQKRYKFTSALRYTLHSSQTEAYLEYDAKASPKTYEALGYLGEGNLSIEKKADELLKFFHKRHLAYTTKPKNLDKNKLVDSFLFDAKNGYCTHFAASFAIAARIAKIPSRVVSGYKVDTSSGVNNYLLVKQKDAHAWVELYLGERGWVRYEPTATAFGSIDISDEQTQRGENKIFQKINLHYMYVKYLINNWILGFDRLKQMSILESLLNDTIYLLKFVFSLFAVVIFSVLLFYFVKNINAESGVRQKMKKVHKVLAKYGLVKMQNETMQAFLLRAQKQLGVSFSELESLYHKAKYSKQKSSLNELAQEIQKIKERLH